MLKNLFLFISLVCFFQIGFAEEVSNYEDAVKLSRETNKEIFLYFGADWCGYCKKMEKVLEDKQVSANMNDYIVLKLNKDFNENLSKRYNVKSIPDYMIIDKDENILKRHKGYKDKKEFLNWLK